MTDEDLKLAQDLKQRRDAAIVGSNRANLCADELVENNISRARHGLAYVIENHLTREQLEVITDLTVAFTAKNLKRAQEAYAKA